MTITVDRLSITSAAGQRAMGCRESMQRFGASLALAGGLIFASVIPRALAQGPAPSPAPADLILEGGRIYTVDAGQPLAEAVAVRAGRVVLVGTKNDARRLKGPRT